MRDNSDRLLTDRLNEITLIKQENDGLRDRVYELERLVRVHKLTDAEQKLEAIRGLIPKLKCDRCISWVGDPCSETCGYLIFKKILEVLGVFGTQEKEQQ